MKECFSGIAIFISVISLITSFFQPEIRRWLKNKFWSKRLNFISLDNLVLFFNQSGAFVRLNITIQPPNDSITVKNIALRIKNQRTDETRILNWGSFLPLLVQQFGGTQVVSFAEAAPERILQYDLKTFKIEFHDTDNFRKNKLELIKGEIADALTNMDFTNMADSLLDELEKSPKRRTWEISLSEEFFWKESSYSLSVIVIDSSGKEYIRTVCFDISQDEYKQFQKNINEFLICDIKRRKNLEISFFTSTKTFADNTLYFENTPIDTLK